MLELYIPVIDGTDPANWKPWEEPLGKITPTVFAAGRMLDDDMADLADCVLTIVFQSRNDLLARKEAEWNRVVGLLVDGSPPQRKDISQTVHEVCKQLLDVPTALYRKIGFHIGVLTPAKVSPDDRRFALSLKAAAEKRLGTSVHVDVAGSSEFFANMIVGFDSALAYALIRDKQGTSA
jgi:hypothetical protein